MRCYIFLIFTHIGMVKMGISTKKKNLYVAFSILWMYSLMQNVECHPSFTAMNQRRGQNQPIIQTNKNHYIEYDKPQYNLDYAYNEVDEEPSSGK